MPMLPPGICTCGRIVAYGARCSCKVLSDRARKARHDARRPSASQRGYDGKWAKARTAFLAEHPACRFCQAPATVVDHIKAHKGDMRLFWSRSNWQPLCTRCHSSIKQSMERSK